MSRISPLPEGRSPRYSPLSSQNARLTFIIAIFWAIPSARCNGGDDFSNNLFSDLSPLLALFGEQVTKQYLGDSMGWADHVLFAMVPLGILTAVVGAIRCGGPRWLKAIVGRAKESRAMVEVELMSSTSADVCELWNGHNLVRTIGKPSIMQLFYLKDPPLASCRGIYLLEEMKGSGWPDMLVVPDLPVSHDPGYGILHVPTQSEIELNKLAQSIEEEEESDPLLDSINPMNDLEANDENQLLLNSVEFPPNISLNTHGGGVSSSEMWFWVFFGLFLQLSLLVFAGVSSLYKGWGRTFYRGDPPKRVPTWAVILNTLGTVFLIVGMIGCCFLIDKSSKEEKYEFIRNKPSIVWLQKGGPVGDQHFNSYAIFARQPKTDSIFKKFFARAFRPGSGSRFITSHRNLHIDNPPPGFSILVVIATCLSLSGFIIQFVALRNLHWSYAVTQLGCTLLMTAVRAWVRRFLFSEPEAKEIEMNYELDFLAREIGGCEPWSADWIFEKDGEDEFKKNAQLATNIEHQFIVDRVFRTRKRLGALSPWESHLRSTTLSLCKAIEDVMKALHESDHIVLNDTSNPNVFTWTIRIRSGTIQKPDELVAELSLHLKRFRPVDNSLAPWGNWIVDQDALEALLSLLMEHKVVRGKTPLLYSENSSRRLFFNSQNAWERQIFKWWVDHRDLWIRGWPDPDTLEPFGGMWIEYTDLNTLCAQEVFASFFSEVSKQLIKCIDGPVKLRLAEKSGLHAFGLRCDVLASLVNIVQESGLGTQGEAFLAIVDPLAFHGKLPELKLAIPDICQRLQDSSLPKLAEAERFLCHLLKAQSVLYLGGKEPDWESATLFLQGELQALIARPAPQKTLLIHLARMLRTLLHQASTGESPKILQLREKAYNIESYRNDLHSDGSETMKTLLGIFQDEPLDPVIEPRQKSMLCGNIPKTFENQWFTKMETLETAVDAGYCEVVDFILSRSCGRAFTTAELKILGESFKKAVQRPEPELVDIFITHLHILAATNSVRLDAIKAESCVCSLAFGGLDSAKQLIESTDIPFFYNTLQRTAGKGDLKMVQLLLDKGVDVNAPAANIDERNALVEAAISDDSDTIQLLLAGNINGRTALQTAAEGGHLEVVQLLLAAGANVNASAVDIYVRDAYSAAGAYDNANANEILLKASINGLTALQAAARGGYLEVVKLLVEKGAIINTKTTQYYGRTAFQAAAEGGNLEVIQFLLEKGAKTSTRAAMNHGRTALQVAAEKGHLQVVRFLLDRGNHVNAPGGFDSGRTALQAAAEGGHLDVVKLLLAEGANINAPPVKFHGRTALQAAAGAGHLEMVQLLLEKGANVNATITQYGRTALQAAAEHGHLDIIKLLLANQADINQPAALLSGRTALQAAAENGHLEVIHLLLQSGADINAPASECHGFTALQAAVRGGHLGIAELFLGKGVDINAPTSLYGSTALQTAAGGGNLEMVRWLLEKGADVNAQLTRCTALQAAAGKGHMEVVELLLEKGANINALAVGAHTLTALQMAARYNRIEMAELLLAKGADVNAPAGEQYGRNALDWATSNCHWRMARLLREAGAIGQEKFDLEVVRWAGLDGQ